MGAVKHHYHDLLVITEDELDAYYDALFEEWEQQHNSYAFEDNYEPFEIKSNSGANNVRRGH